MEIRTVKSAEELREVCRLRYDIYLGELRLKDSHANHKKHEILDPLDQTGTILAAFDQDEIVGTLRIDLASKGLGQYEEFFELRSLMPYYPSKVSMTGKLVVAPDHRHSCVALELAKAAFQFYLSAGICFDVICCQSSKKSAFEHFGYRQLLPDALHEDYGTVHRMILVVNDKQHFVDTGSPFAAMLPDRPDEHGSVDFFYTNLLQRE